MPKVIGIRFKRAGKVYYFDPGDLVLPVASGAIVETARGIEYGDVVVGAREVNESEVVQPLKRVVRQASEVDLARVAENQRREKEALQVAQKKIADHNLDMYVVDIEFAFDGSKITFYFTAEGRVDFRELVKDLASIFRTRIELRQIGVRDEAKMLGGIGPCGRPLCCSTFLGDFAPVSIRMAKDQNLSLNPTKISGICGRLLCCLRYEADSEGYSRKGKGDRAHQEPPLQDTPGPLPDLDLDLAQTDEPIEQGVASVPVEVQDGKPGRPRERRADPEKQPRPKPPQAQDQGEGQKRRRRRRRRGGGQGAAEAPSQVSAGNKPSPDHRERTDRPERP